jgi:4-hydroxy-3-methylbut-2-enyl diphosphate reductase
MGGMTTSVTPPAETDAPQDAKRVLLAAPRGYCAGVDRAVVTVEKALELYGPPVYVRKEIVHNKHVVTTLEKRGAIFVEETDEVPEGATVVFSAHGVAPVVHDEAKALSLKTIDATCPLVTKVHREAVRFADDDFDILLIGHEGHEEVVGTSGEAPEHITLVDGPDDVENVTVRDPEKVVWLSQTTLSVDETMETVARLKEKFPALQSPPSDDICYATQNRQLAVKQMAQDTDQMLVVGSRNSSHSGRLVEVALEHGARDGHLVDFADDDFDILLIGHEGHEEVIGTSGEAPEHITLVEGPDDVANVEVRDPDKVVWLSQTTLSVDETMETVRRLREKFPKLQDPPSDDICYATQNRQLAVKQMAKDCDLMIVVGSRNSSNSVRLVEVAIEHGSRDGHLVDYADEIDESWLDGVRTVGVTSGASVPEILVRGVLDFLAERGYGEPQPVTAAEESLLFALPKELRRDLKAAGMSDQMKHDAGALGDAGQLH